MVLGALATFSDKQHILDIGAGTGVLGMMIAQRHPEMRLTGVENNVNAAIDCRFNYANHNFPNPCQLIEADFLQLSTIERFDAFIINPPFYTEGYLGNDPELNQAKHVGEMTLSAMIEKMDELAAEEAECWLIWPFETAESLFAAFANVGWNMKKSIVVYGKPGVPKRIVQCWKKTDRTMPIATQLTIRDEKGQYTPEYKELTLDFHGVKL